MNKNKILEVRKKIDIEIKELVKCLAKYDINHKVAFRFGKTELNHEIWKWLMQWFNHQSHHRGQISVMLDMQKISNDYSMVLDKIS